MRRLIIIIALLSVAWQARADIFERFGASSLNIAIAGAGATLSDDYGAIYECPSALTFGRQRVIGISFLGSINRAGINLSKRPLGYDPPDLGGSSLQVPYKYLLRKRHSISSTENVYGVVVGGNINLFSPNITFGAVAFLPTTGLGSLSTHYNDEREQFFSNSLDYELIGERLRTSQILVGMGIRFLKHFAVGGSVKIMIGSHSDAYTYIPESNSQYINLKGSGETKLSYIISGTYHSNWGLSASLIYREHSYARFHGITEIQVNGTEGSSDYPEYRKMDLILDYSPRQVVLSLGFMRPKFFVTGDIGWYQWSKYLDNHDRNPDFKDTFSPAIGGGYRILKNTMLMAGFRYIPTPVKDLSGRYNYVDNNTVVIATGLRHKISLGKSMLSVGGLLQLQLLVPRKVVKSIHKPYPVCKSGETRLCDEVPDDLIDPTTGKPEPQEKGLQTGNPGFPGFYSGGWYLVMAGEVQWEY